MIRHCSTKPLAFLAWALLAAPAPALPQDVAHGSLEGVVRDSRGLELPGVTVSLFGAEIVGYRAATTDENGGYRFPSLPAGTYTITCRLLGYEPLQREAVAVDAGRALTLDLALSTAALEEKGPEAIGPPVVDTRSTVAEATLVRKQLDDLPSAANMWAVLDGSAGIQMRGYDVGGSHKGQQTGYEAFGIRGQNRIVNDGVNTTEGKGDAGGYYDYHAVEEFKVAAQGLGVEMSTPGAQVTATFKSGQNRFTGLLQGGYEHEDLVVDNLDDELAARGATPAEIREYYDYHLDLGGPIVKDRAWFYVAYNRVFLDRAVSGQDPELATDIADFDMYTAKLTARLGARDRLTGFAHWSFKQQPSRGLSALVAQESTLAQESTTELYKLEWERTWSDRLTTSVMLGSFGYEWDLVPQADPAVRPPRLDTATGAWSGAGWGGFTSRRFKPQSTGRITWHVPPGRLGSHDLTLGWDWQIDRGGPAWSAFGGGVRYLDNSLYGAATSVPEVFVDRIQFANVPNQGETDHNQHTDFFLQDAWRVNDRLSLTLGVRVGRQHVYYDAVANDPLQSDVFAPTSAPGADVLDEWNVAPRLGAAFDLSGRGKSVLKAYYGRFYANLGSGLPTLNPGGRGLRTYEFLDLDGDAVYDGPQELGRLLDASGGGATRFDPGFELPYSDELSFAFEQELGRDVGLRLAYVRKRYRNWWEGHVNLAQALNLTNPVTATCTGCPLGLDGATLDLLTVPDDQPSLVDSRLMNVPLLPTSGGEDTDMLFTSFQVQLTRRFRDNFFLTASFDSNDRDELRGPPAWAGRPVADPLEQGWFLNHSLDVENRQETSYWTAKLLTRYVAPHEIGLSLSVRHQSGYPWAPVHHLRVPNVGTKAILLTDLEDNRSDDVTLVDLRLDKAFRFGGHYRLTFMADAYNLLNANPVTSFVLDTGSRFEDVIEWLPGLTFKFGLRLEF